MSRGGSRVGSGRKGLTAKERRLRTHRAPGVQPASVDVPEPPRSLTKTQRAIWRDLAPLAVDARTLVPATRGAFQDLVEAVDMKARILRALDAQGVVDGEGDDEPGTGEPSKLLTKYDSLLRRVESLRARFLLAPSGRAIEVPDDDPDRWAEFTDPLKPASQAQPELDPDWTDFD